MDVHEDQPSSPSSASILEGAHDVRIDRAKITNVAGNSSADYSSNTYIFIKQESGLGFPSRNMLVLLLLASLFFRLLL